MAINSKNNCLHYWDLCTVITIDAAVALWCDVEPSLLKNLDYSTSCMDVKRELIEQALCDSRLEYRSSSDAWHNANLDELLQKDQVRIKKDSLRRWFLDMSIEDRPAFLFDESRTDNIPDGGEVADMNTTRALAIMAWILSENRPALSIGGKPNAAAIGKAIEPLAQAAFGGDVRGFASFHKKISKALELLNSDGKADLFSD